MINQMRKFVALILGSLLLLLTACGGSSANVTNLDVDGFASNIKNPGVVVLDVRTPGEFATGHIENAINIDVEGMTFDSEIAKLDKNVEYAVYCRSGRRSVVATEKMAEAGFTKLTNLQDGVISWQGAGYPLVNN
jgi:rhodanese-related sulfurtransferase